MVICTEWEQLPERVDHDEGYDITALSGCGPGRHRTVCIDPGKQVTVLGADDRTVRNLSFFLSGESTLRLISVHLMGREAHPPVRISGGGNRLIGERAMELMCDGDHPAVRMDPGGEASILVRGPCRCAISGIGGW